jgi:hypothetical protein
MELDSKPYGAVSAGRHLHVWGFTLTVWCFALWIVFPALLVGLGSGVGVGYGAFHHDDPCLGDMSQWQFEDGVDPAKHPIVLVNGSHLAVVDHTVGGDSCIVRFSETLKAKDLVYYAPNVVQGRRLKLSNEAYVCIQSCANRIWQICTGLMSAKYKCSVEQCSCGSYTQCDFCTGNFYNNILSYMQQGSGSFAAAQKNVGCCNEQGGS